MKNNILDALEEYLKRIGRLDLVGGMETLPEPTLEDKNVLIQRLQEQQKTLNKKLTRLTGLFVLLLVAVSVVAGLAIYYETNSYLEVAVAIFLEIIAFSGGLEYAKRRLNGKETRALILQGLECMSPEEVADFVENLHVSLSPKE